MKKTIFTLLLIFFAFQLTAGNTKAEVNAYLIKDDEGNLYEYSKSELEEAYVNHLFGEQDDLYDDFISKIQRFDFFAFRDNKTGKYVAYQEIIDAFLEDSQNFNLNAFVEDENRNVVIISHGKFHKVSKASSIVQKLTMKEFINKIEPLRIEVSIGEEYIAPKKVLALLNSGLGKEVDVRWNEEVDTSKSGVYTLKGVVDGFLHEVDLIVTVKATHALSSFEQQVFELTNEERAKHGLPLLSIDLQLSKVARIKSEDMRDVGYFSHQSPTYGSPFTMMQNFGITYRMAGENIAYGQITPQSVVTAWMDSPPHRANILHEEMTHLGVGYAEGGSGRHYWTQMFMREWE